jgi:hypothetical protein
MPEERRGKRTEGERHRAAVMWGSGIPRAEILAEVGIDRRTLWEWRQTPEFQKVAEEAAMAGLAEAATRMKGLAPNVVEAFERGLASTHRQQAMKVKQLSVEGEDVFVDAIKVVELEDNGLAVRTADLVSQRIPEIGPRRQVDVDVDVSVRVAQLIRELDADLDGEPDDRQAAPPPPPPPP